MLLGFKDFSVYLAFVLSFIIMMICAIYGLKNWNSEGEISKKELEEEKKWIKEEIKIEKDLNEGGDL